jgi:hypothetical protein
MDTEKLKSIDTITDFVTGKKIPDIGAEANRQAVEHFLVDIKGFDKQDIEVDAGIEIVIGDESYRSQIDLVVWVDGQRFMIIKCAAGSLESRRREILAAARLIDRYQIPVAVVSDGKTAIVLDTVSGEKTGEGLDAVWCKDEAKAQLNAIKSIPYPADRLEREKLIFRSYDSMNVNVNRNVS